MDLPLDGLHIKFVVDLYSTDTLFWPCREKKNTC